MERKLFKTTIGGREVTVETGAYCGQANGSCLVRCGDTVVMVNATMAKEPREGMDYFPLSVDYEEKMYAVGKIPGGFKKREGRASDKAILTARLIDRPIRPLFPKGMYNDVSVVATVLSVDTNIPPEVFGMLGSSIALSISDIPFAGPTGSVVVGLVDGEYVINPDSAQRAKSRLHLSLAGTKDAIMMVEAGANEVSEQEMLGAILFGHEEIKKIVAFIEGIVAEVGKPKAEIALETIPEDIDAAVRAYADKKMDYVLESFDRTERDKREDALNEDVLAHFAGDFEDRRLFGGFVGSAVNRDGYHDIRPSSCRMPQPKWSQLRHLSVSWRISCSERPYSTRSKSWTRSSTGRSPSTERPHGTRSSRRGCGRSISTEMA